jgi:hypothetical protein
MARRHEEHKAINTTRQQPLKLLSNQSMVAGGTIAGKCVFRKSDEAALRIVAPQQFGGRSHRDVSRPSTSATIRTVISCRFPPQRTLLPILVVTFAT